MKLLHPVGNGFGHGVEIVDRLFAGRMIFGVVFRRTDIDSSIMTRTFLSLAISVRRPISWTGVLRPERGHQNRTANCQEYNSHIFIVSPKRPKSDLLYGFQYTASSFEDYGSPGTKKQAAI